MGDSVESAINHQSKKKTILFGIVMIGIILISSYATFKISTAYYSNHFEKITKKVMDAVVVIEIKDPSGNYVPICSGFVVDKKGYVLTASHCYSESTNKINSQNDINLSSQDIINNGGYIHLVTPTIDKHLKIQNVKQENLERKDVQLFRITDKIDFDLPSVEIATKEEVSSEGLEVGFVGYTKSNEIKDFEMFVSKGVLSNKKLDLNGQTEPWYSINAFSTFGYSGGPVYLSKNGKVIGLISGGESDGTGKTGIVFVPPVHEVPAIINSYIA